MRDGVTTEEVTGLGEAPLAVLPPEVIEPGVTRCGWALPSSGAARAIAVEFFDLGAGRARKTSPGPGRR